MNFVLEKQRIRKGMLAKREQLPEQVRAAYNETITQRLLQLPAYQHADTVLGYMNFGSEFASENWVALALSQGKRLVLPRVNCHTNALELYRVDDPENQLEAGLWGIREPVVERCEQLKAINEVEFILLPGIAFDQTGARLGYGGGFYDKLLAHIHDASIRPALAAAAFGLQIVERIPQEKTDVSVEWIVTETETINCLANVQNNF